MKLKTGYLSVVLAFMSLVIMLIILINTQRPIRSYTENMQDCMSKGGQYSLHLEANSDREWEQCTLDEEIKY